VTSLSPLVVVEDNDEDFEALSRVLRETTSYEGVVRYQTGEEALEGLLSGERPAIVILDLNLPGLQGVEVLRRVKADPKRRMVPIVVLSGSDRQEDIDAAYEAGANAYLSKPLDFGELRRVVRSMHDFWQIAALPEQR
jgi:two-component system, response regulator